MSASWPFVILLFCAAAASAQSRVEFGTGVVHENQYIDIETGTVLSKARLESVRAEWKLEVDSGGLRVIPCEGSTLARWDGRLGTDGPEPDPETFSDKPLKIDGQMSIAGRTSDGRLYKALLTPPWPESSSQWASVFARQVGPDLQVDFALLPKGAAAVSAARDLRAHFRVGKGVVTWKEGGNGNKWRVEWFRSGVSRPDGSVVVEGARAELDQLADGKVYRVVVSPIGADGTDGEPRTIPLLAAEQGLRKFQFEATQEGGVVGIAVDLREGRAGSGDPDCTFDFTSVRAPEGGGVQWLGDAASDFADAKPLPEYGYRSRVLISMKGGVFAVRMRDGRYAKVWFDWDRQSRDRGRIIEVHGLALLGGGRGSNPPPEGFKGSFKDGRVTLEWRTAKEAAQYAIVRRIGDSEEELGRTEKGAFVDEKPPLFGSAEYGVCWIDMDGVRSVPAIAVVDTWPPEYSRGSARIRWIDGSFDFRTFKVIGGFGHDVGADEADFHFDRNGGGGGVPLVCATGIAIDTPGDFGRFDWKEAAGFKRETRGTSVSIPRDVEKPVVVRLLTRDGGYAHVRFEKSEGFDLKMTWVHLGPPKPPDLDTMSRQLLEKAPELTEAETKEMQDLVAQLAADDADLREAAEKRLVALEIKAVRELIGAVKTSRDAEQRARITRLLEKIWAETQ